MAATLGIHRVALTGGAFDAIGLPAGAESVLLQIVDASGAPQAGDVANSTSKSGAGAYFSLSPGQTLSLGVRGQSSIAVRGDAAGWVELVVEGA